MGYFGYWSPGLGRMDRIRVYVLGLIDPDRHVWAKYMRGIATRRGRCLRCGVTAYWEERLEIPNTCEETRKYLIVHGVIES